MDQGLILVDIQNDYFSGGKMELFNMDQAANNAKRLLGQFRDRKLPVFHIQHLSEDPGATFFVPETAGVEINEAVSPLHDEIILQKHYPNSFRETALAEHLFNAGVRHLIICGAMSHMCIDATTRAAFDLSYDCTVVEDACATRNMEYRGHSIDAKDVHGAFMSALASVYAGVVRTQDVRIG